MQIELKNNQFIEIKDLIKVLDIETLIKSYIFENFSLKGEYVFKIKYCSLLKQLDEEEQLELSIPFEIVIPDAKEVNSLELLNFEYFAVERRGIEVELNLRFNYLTEDEIDENINKEINEIFDSNFDVEIEEKEEIFPRLEKRTRFKI